MRSFPVSDSLDLDIEAQLRAMGYSPLGTKSLIRNTGRTHLYTLETGKGLLWVKHGYHLPPGEGAILSRLTERWQRFLPEIVYASVFTLVSASMPGVELTPDHPLPDWVHAANALGQLLKGEASEVDAWLALGVRDRRADAWEPAVLALRKSPIVEALDRSLLAHFDDLLPDFLERYVNAFRMPPTLIPQDSGCCNIHVTENGPLFFDWADVVVGHPVFSCDRLLDQTPAAYRDAVIEAFCDPLGLSRSDFKAMRRSNVLHEVLRYHDELAFIEPEDPQYQTLAKAVQSQLKVLIDFEVQKKLAT